MAPDFEKKQNNSSFNLIFDYFFPMHNDILYKLANVSR